MWKRKHSNLIVAAILSICYTIVTLLNIIGPLHVNETGEMNQLGWLSVYSLLYYIFGLIVTWMAYFYFRDKPKPLFIFLIIFGIGFILFQNYLWGWWGSTS